MKANTPQAAECLSHLTAELGTVLAKKSKLRTPTKTDMENAECWLSEAQYYLTINEYYRVKQLCKQVIRSLRRKDDESV
jgi:predicted glutamine amidotransferase